MTNRMAMLRFGGYINIIIAIGHIVGLFWPSQMFDDTGIGGEMTQLTEIHPIIPYLITIFVALVFLVFGLYGLSADGRFKKLPFLKPAIFIIGLIFILRGVAELVFDTIDKTSFISATLYSLLAFAIGLLFIIGGLRKWKMV